MRAFSVSIGIGAKLLPSLRGVVSGVEQRFGAMNRRLRLQAAETKLAMREMVAAASPIAGLAASGGLAIGLSKSIGAGAAFQHQISMMRTMGRTAKETSEAVAQATRTMLEVPTSTLTDNLRVINETTMAFGGIKHAIESLSSVQKMSGMLSNVLGEEHGLSKDAAYSLIKSLEMRGMGTKGHPGFDKARFDNEMGQFYQASVASGGKVTPDEFLNFTKRASPFMQGFSDRYLYRIAPTLIQEQGGDIAGTQNATWLGTILGKAKNKISTEAWMKLGLLDPKQVVYNKVGPVAWKPGAIRGTDLAMRDPLEWSERVLLPALKGKGVDTTNILSMQKALMPLFRDRNAGRLATTLASLQTNTNLHKDERLINQVPGLNRAYAAAMRQDPTIAWTATKAAASNLSASIFGGAMTDSPMSIGLMKLSGVMDHVAATIVRHKNLAKGLFWGLTGTAAVAGIKTMGLSLKWALSPLWKPGLKIGGALWRGLAPGVMRGILAFGTRIAAWKSLIGPAVRTAFSGIGVWARAGIIAARPFVAAGLREIGPFFMAGLRPLGGVLLTGLRIAAGFLTGPVGLAIMAVTAGLLIYRFRSQVAAGWHAVTGWFSTTAWPAIKGTLSGVADWGRGIVDGIIAGLSSSWSRLKAWVANGWRSIMPSWLGGGSVLPQAAPVAPPAVAGPPKLRLVHSAPIVTPALLRKPVAPVVPPMLAAPIAGKRALGGPVEKGRRYVVGEQGREEFVPEQDGKIVPHGELERRRAERAAPAGPITINIYGVQDPQAVGREVERKLRQMGRQNARLYND